MTQSREKIFSILTAEVKKKKELKGLQDDFILKEVNKFFLSNPQMLKDLSKKEDKDLERSSILKGCFKEIRKVLHRNYGSFKPENSGKREKLLEKLSNSHNKMDKKFAEQILGANKSSRERLTFYEAMYKDIFHITGPPKTLIDLGCGMNPVSFPLMNLKELSYLATEISQDDVDFLNNYFKIMRDKGLSGEALLLDLNNEKSISRLKGLYTADICFMFKLLESLEQSKTKRYKLIESIITGVNAKWIVASFATKTLSQRDMKFIDRRWLEAMLDRLKKPYSKLEKYNEIFYIIENK